MRIMQSDFTKMKETLAKVPIAGKALGAPLIHPLGLLS